MDNASGAAFDPDALRQRIEMPFKNKHHYEFNISDEQECSCIVGCKLELKLKNTGTTNPTKPIFIGFKESFEKQVKKTTGENLKVKGLTEGKRKEIIEKFRRTSEGRKIHQEIWSRLLI